MTVSMNTSPRLVRKYARIFVRCSKMRRFLRAKLEENCELRGTNNVHGYIYEHIFRQIETIGVYYPSNICKARETELFMNSLPFAAWDVQCSLVQLYQ